MATMLSPNAIPKGSITQEMIDVSVLDAKQDVIDDLYTIREGAKIGNEAFDIITSMVNAGYLFAGIATPTTGPALQMQRYSTLQTERGHTLTSVMSV